MQKESEPMTTREVAELLGLTQSAVVARVRIGTLTAKRKIADRIFIFDREEVERSAAEVKRGRPPMKQNGSRRNGRKK